MTEYYIELQDKDGTGYSHCYPYNDTRDILVVYDNLDEARMDAKNLLRDDIVLTRIIEYGNHRVVDFYEVK